MKQNERKIQPYDSLAAKLISIGVTLNDSMDFPKKYRVRHHVLIKELYTKSVSEVSGEFGSCGAIEAYQLLSAIFPAKLKNKSFTLSGTTILIDLDILKEVILSKYKSHPLCMYIR